jgi:hypothetical protein
VEETMSLSFLDRLRKQLTQVPVPQFDGLSQARAYWEAVRPAGGLPGRGDLDPRGFGGSLDRVFLAERVGRGVAQIRIAGSTLCAFAEMDLRGLPLGCLFAAETRPILGESLEAVFAGPAVCEIDLGSDRSGQGKALARMLLMPLAPDNGLSQVVGAIAFSDPTPRRCKLQSLARRLEQMPPEALAWPEETTVRPPAPIRTAGHLALVYSAG